MAFRRLAGVTALAATLMLVTAAAALADMGAGNGQTPRSASLGFVAMSDLTGQLNYVADPLGQDAGFIAHCAATRPSSSSRSATDRSRSSSPRRAPTTPATRSTSRPQWWTEASRAPTTRCASSGAPTRRRRTRTRSSTTMGSSLPGTSRSWIRQISAEVERCSQPSSGRSSPESGMGAGSPAPFTLRHGRLSPGGGGVHSSDTRLLISSSVRLEAGSPATFSSWLGSVVRSYSSSSPVS